MSRYVYEIILFFLPFIAYALYLRATGRGWRAPERWLGVPLAWLLGTGLALVALSLLVAALTGGYPISSVYVPAHLENGRLVPGRTVMPTQ